MNALENFRLSAAKRYLQSAVFVDDNIFEAKSAMPLNVDISIPVRKPIFKKKAVSSAGPSITLRPPDEGQSYRIKDIVNSFAKLSIICALYEPRPGFSTDYRSDVYKLCERADIIVLDWDFSGDSGARALSLIAALVRQSKESQPHHVRLLAVYTADLSLVGVANSIADYLIKEKMEAAPIGSQYRIQSGAVRLVVLGKPGSRFGEEETFTISERDLAERLVDEFASMNVGILPSVALHGLATIRRNSRRILERFHGELDGAFLVHRAMVSLSEEAFNQLPEVLADELRAVIEDDPINGRDANEIALAAEQQDLPSQDKELLQLVRQKAKVAKVASKLLEGGAAPSGHQRLASLFSSRTYYTQESRQLGFGTVVKFRVSKNKPWQFAVCLVPACDSLRLPPGQRARFPFWTLRENVYSGGKKGRKGFILDHPSVGTVSLAANGSAGDMMWTDTFSVDKVSQTVLAKGIDGVFQYRGSRRTIQWIGQLKPLHAHRIARGITEDLSRVGLTEADWIRRLCDIDSPEPSALPNGR